MNRIRITEWQRPKLSTIYPLNHPSIYWSIYQNCYNLHQSTILSIHPLNHPSILTNMPPRLAHPSKLASENSIKSCCVKPCGGWAAGKGGSGAGGGLANVNKCFINTVKHSLICSANRRPISQSCCLHIYPCHRLVTIQSAPSQAVISGKGEWKRDKEEEGS